MRKRLYLPIRGTNEKKNVGNLFSFVSTNKSQGIGIRKLYISTNDYLKCPNQRSQNFTNEVVYLVFVSSNRFDFY